MVPGRLRFHVCRKSYQNEYGKNDNFLHWQNFFAEVDSLFSFYPGLGSRRTSGLIAIILRLKIAAPETTLIAFQDVPLGIIVG